MEMLAQEGSWLVITFAFLMGLSILLYVILDGYDLGVGILLLGAEDEEKDLMIASIGPFWDANETWLVMGIGILLTAFPLAHGIILSTLYIPTAILLIALVLRGVSFDFRAKVAAHHKHWWNYSFFIGSLLAALAQGYMLGLYIMEFETGLRAQGFALLTGLCVAAGYAFIGACWLVMKTEHALQRKAIRWARLFLLLTAVGIGLVSIATPFMSERIYEKWFSFPNLFILAPIPLLSGTLIIALELFILRKMPFKNDAFYWLPFISAIGLYVSCFLGLAYSFFPFIIPDRMTIFEAASAPESLQIILYGALGVLPFILGYTFYAYRIFWGKVRPLSYY